ncbi:MAG: flagellar motor protein [Methylococcaceae bacterium]|nr:flagellar motor protein [Methylococcaceae bacterium]MCI0666551.1 flagellar motor protein [Methylococcaceae bacterium]MCI0734639.1 flagellar motor protein [Methylococcaceae bacterium]
MDVLSVIGLIVGLGAVIGGNLIEGGHFDALMNGPAFFIVVGGTIGATLLQVPPAICRHAVRIIVRVFVPEKIHLEVQIKKLVSWSTLARKEGLLGLEALLDAEKDSFAKKGLQLLVDGSEPEIIRDCMEVELNAREQRDIQAARVFEAMGGYSPTIGIIGAVLGLIHVMKNLSDPALLGPGIATAFVATIYGVGLANLFFLPIANKLKAQTHALVQARELVIEGIISIADGENPRNIEAKLSGYLE